MLTVLSVSTADTELLAGGGGRALLDSGGTISVICGDLREPDTILEHPQLCKLIDFSEPVGLADSEGSRWLYGGVARKP